MYLRCNQVMLNDAKFHRSIVWIFRINKAIEKKLKNIELHLFIFY